jgi:hypothetical protein
MVVKLLAYHLVPRLRVNIAVLTLPHMPSLRAQTILPLSFNLTINKLILDLNHHATNISPILNLGY